MMHFELIVEFDGKLVMMSSYANYFIISCSRDKHGKNASRSGARLGYDVT